MAVSKTAGWGFEPLLACHYYGLVNYMSKKFIDVISFSAIAIVLLATFFLSSVYSLDYSIRAIFYIVSVLVSFYLFYLTGPGKQTYVFILEAQAELKKVVWPTRQETTQTTMIVVVMVAISGFILWGVDSIFTWIISRVAY